jgi:uncharacterized protein (TIGR04222 family)
MNPFALTGPAFLVLYLGVCAGSLALAWAIRRAGEPSGGGSAQLNDPYAIACLRGGAEHALAVAAFSLLERGLLERTKGGLRAVPGVSLQLLGSRELADLERGMLRLLGSEHPLSALRRPAFRALCDPLRDCLIADGLLQGSREERRCRWARWLILTAVIGVVAARIATADPDADTKVGLLVVSMALACWAIWRVAAPGRTRRGDHHLAEIARRVGSSQHASRECDPHSAAVYSAAAHGWNAVPVQLHPYAAGFGDLGSAGNDGDGAGDGGGGDGGGGCGGCGGG